VIRAGSVVRLNYGRSFGPPGHVVQAGTVAIVIKCNVCDDGIDGATSGAAVVYRLDLLFPAGNVEFCHMSWFSVERAFDEVFASETELIK